MNITITDTIIVIIALALLLQVYASRRAVTTGVARSFAKDHIKGQHHRDQDKQLKILRDRLSLLTGMAILTSLGSIAAFASTIFVIYSKNSDAKILLVIAVVLGALGLLQATRESMMSNKSVFIELDSTIQATDPYHQSNSA